MPGGNGRPSHLTRISVKYGGGGLGPPPKGYSERSKPRDRTVSDADRPVRACVKEGEGGDQLARVVGPVGGQAGERPVGLVRRTAPVLDRTSGCIRGRRLPTMAVGKGRPVLGATSWSAPGGDDERPGLIRLPVKPGAERGREGGRTGDG